MFSSFKRHIRNIALKGRNVKCCLCNRRYLTFLPSGDEIKAHSRCPGCYSTDRNRQLWLTLKPLIGDTEKSFRLLHVAPEKPLSNQLIKMRNIRYSAIDKFEKGYKYPSYVKEMDLTNLQFGNDTFDLFLCSHVLEHIADDRTAMKELYRVLKPGGDGYIMIPYFPELETTLEDFSINTPDMRKKIFGQADHVRKYGRDFTLKLQNAGFEVETISFENSYTHEQKVKMGLLNAETFFHVRKSILNRI